MNQRQPTRSTIPVSARRFRFAVVTAAFNASITDPLRDGALACLACHGVDIRRVRNIACPGAFELPQVANLLAARADIDAVICLGAVIRGETPHFDFVAAEAARGIQEVSLRHGKPVVFGVLTTDTVRQARERVGGRHGHKGWDAALTAIAMAELFKNLKRRPK